MEQQDEKEDIHPDDGPPEPYRVLKRYRGIGGGLGRLYEARNTETGNPALVLMPAPKGDLRAEEDWQVRATANVTPPYLALEVERAPANGQPRQLTWMLERWAVALMRIDTRPEARDHLTAGPQKPSPPRSRPPSGGALIALLLALGVTPWTHATPGPTTPAVAPPVLTVDGPDPASALYTNGTDVIALPMPQGPFRGQNRPPCKSRHEIVLRGGCWVEIAARPPCGDDAYELEGKCYLPGYSAPRPPQALNP
ncbi:MAG TPA: hypothetical protein VFZ09_31775 [Archangium sp.]|uniref:hypothetical protein n=1 Tax=Archangium sp. TaxID=1872627 RepID=UPI002E3414D6|nr:hypothetical protein [Archangium sp.]HEX5750847.1 hypothetical protein [Archangium sp.]